MLTLTDKVFLPITVFVLNVGLAILKFILISAVGACFAIYAKYGGEYAKSVGWIRSAGYLEMVHTFRSTSKRKDVPGLVKWALVVAFFVTLAASFLDKGIAIFVTPASRPGPHTTVLAQTTQSGLDGVGNIFVGWEIPVQGNDSAKDTMKKALSSRLANPDATDGWGYDPITNAYDTTCTDFSVDFFGNLGTTNGCAKAFFNFFTLDFRTKVLKMSERSPNLWSIAVEKNMSTGAHNFLDSPLSVTLSVKNWSDDCRLVENYRLRGPWEGLTVGITAFPRTLVSKCFIADNKIVATAVTTTRHSVAFLSDNVIDGRFANESDELLLGMREALKGPDLTLKNGTSTVLVELRVANSTINFYACATSKRDRETGNDLECIYASTNMFVFTQEPNSELLAAIRGSNNRIGSAFMSLDFSMRTSTTMKIPNDRIEQDTVAVADYMAQLGYNFYLGWGRYYILYNATEPRPGFEVPLWVLIIAGIILLINLTLWQLTYWLVGSPHNSSVYSVIRDRLASRSNTPIPRLMRFQYEPLMFEDVKLLPDRVNSMSNEYRFLLGGVTVDTSPKTE